MRRILGVKLRQQFGLAILLRVQEEHDQGPDRDCSHPDQVGGVSAMEESCLRGMDDLRSVLGMLLGDRHGATE